MIIRRYSCRRFAGITDKTVEFGDNLNVVLGPNEAGKSTLVEGIYSVLFRSSNIGKRKTSDKEFRSRFMPISSGDSIDGRLVVLRGKENYVVKKEWGANSSSELTLPDSGILRDQEAVEEALGQVLGFGEGTYRSIVFSNQKLIKSAIENIIKNREATDEVGSLLRKAIMELEGISLGDLGRNIDREIKNLTGRWDMEKEYPENNRGINKPYSNGLGQIVTHFYKKENIKRQMQAALEIEKKTDRIISEIEEAEGRISEIKKKKESMSGLEQDVHRRLVLEPKLAGLKKEMDRLVQTTRQWPKSELRLEQLEKEIDELEKKRCELEKEKEKAGKIQEKLILERRLERIKELEEKIGQGQKAAEAMTDVSQKDMENLDRISGEIATLKAKMEAGTMFAKATGIKSGIRLFATTDLNEPSELIEGEEINANGYMRIESEELGKIEIKSGKMDFAELRRKYIEGKEGLEKLLDEIGAKDIEDARLRFRRIEETRKEIEGGHRQIEELLDGESRKELVGRISAFGDFSKLRELTELGIEDGKLYDKSLELKSEKDLAERDIAKWTEAYGDMDGLFDRTMHVKIEAGEIEKQMERIAPLPQGFESAEEFLRQLSETRTALEEKTASILKLKDKYYQLESEKPELTYEELSIIYGEEEKKFEKSLSRAKKMIEIKSAFESTKISMDEDSFKPVMETFSRYLSVLTNDVYKVSAINDDLDFAISNDSETLMPVELLSSGTYDSVALALRLAILESILRGEKGFLVLDDCLVDMDPLRKDRAVKLIKDFSKDHQVVFTTCSPETAKALGGNIINM